MGCEAVAGVVSVAVGNAAGAIDDVMTCAGGVTCGAGGMIWGAGVTTCGAGDASIAALGCAGLRVEPVASASRIGSDARGGRADLSTGFDEPTLRSSTGAAF